MHYIGVGLALGLFWLLLSGHLAGLLLGLGALSVGVVLALCWRMDRVDGEPGLVPLLPKLWAYALWLLGSVVRANIDVAKRVWTPGQTVKPSWRRLDTELRSHRALTLYANSITLTPGTLTTDVGPDYLVIHSLSAEGHDELVAGEMERRVKQVGL